MSGVAIFGTVLDKAGLTEWVDSLVERAVAEGEVSAEQVAELRKSVEDAQRAVVPMQICENTKTDEPFGIHRMVLKDWNGVYTEHRWELPALGDVINITHIVMVEGPARQVDQPFYFAGKVITGQFGICVYDATKNEYSPIHCVSCAMTIIDMISNTQQRWAREQGVDVPEPKQRTHEAPQRLQ